MMASAQTGVHILTLDRVKVSETLTRGERFIKWCDQDPNSASPVTLKVDPNGFFLHWQDQTKKETHFLDISQIRDVRTGPQARVPRDARLRELVSVGGGHQAISQKTVTVVHGTDFVNTNFLNFCTNKPEVAQEWHDQLLKIVNNVLASNISSHEALVKIHTQIKLLRDANDKIPVKNIHKLFALNKEDRKLIERALASAGLPSHKNDEISAEKFQFKDFFNFYTHLVQRTEVEKIFNNAKIGDSKRNALTIEEFMNFVNSQRDPRLNEILFPYCTAEKAQELINKYEQSQFNIKKRQLGFDGFLHYLMSEENQIVSPELFDLHADMDLPLSHYFIQSSHNTYLTGHQWTGKASVEMYRQVLLAGCRCIELDLWDGRTKEEEPVIVHGYTLVPEILAKDVIMAIAECAFKTSEFPLILSFENHCKAKQQAKIAQYCKEYFGEMLLTEALDSLPLKSGVSLPSPSALRGRILIKNKKKHHHAKPKDDEDSKVAAANGEASVASPRVVGVVDMSSESEDDDDEDDDELEEAAKGKENNAKEEKAAEEISALVNYVQAVRFHGFEQAERKDRAYEMSSFDETNAVSMLKEYPVEFVKYNRRQLSRIFPKGTRLDSSNFMPQVFWNAGCQLVALNYQTLDLPMQLNLGIYEYNRRAGYLRKPVFMCRDDRIFDPFADTPVDGIVPGTVSMQILSGQFLTDKHVGTYVEVDMFGLPCDTVRKKFRTKVVPNNGICPQFNEEPFLFKQVVLPDLAVVRIGVYEESGRQIGHRVLPVLGLRPGYRHDYVPDRFSDFAEALANPIRYQSEQERRTQQLKVLTGEEEEEENEGNQDDLKRTGSVAKHHQSELMAHQKSQPRSASLRRPPPSPSPSSPRLLRRAERSPSQPQPLESQTSLVTNPSSPEISEMSSLKADSASVETFLQHKSVVDKIADRDKKITLLNKKFEKEVEKLRKSHQAKESKALKPSSAREGAKKLVMRVVDKSSDDKEENLERLRRQYEEKLEALTKDKERTEKELRSKYSEMVLSCAEKRLKLAQQSQLKQLQATHERECAEMMKKLEAKAQEEIKDDPDETDKEELLRLKKEKRSFIIKRGTEERRQLNELYQKKEEEMRRLHEEMKKELKAQVIMKVKEA